MGIFDKPIVDCVVCERVIGAREKRWKTKDGFLCADCQKPFFFDGSRVFVNYSKAEMKEHWKNRVNANTELQENRILFETLSPTKVVENLIFIDEEKEKWYFDLKTKGLIYINDDARFPKVFDFSEILDVYITVGDKIITSTSSTKREKGIRKAILGGVIAGGAGAIVGGMMAKQKTTTNTVITNETLVNVITTYTTDSDEPLSFKFNNDNSANNVYKSISKMIKNPLIEDSADEKPIETDYNDLRNLKKLLDEQIITEEEFNNKKKQLLGI